jgi:hypothetical protein
MATIRKERSIDAPAADVWDALRDWGAIHERLGPGFVTDARLDGEDRIVTFFNGGVVREVFAPEGDRARFVWTADLLPDEAAAPTAEMMERGIEVLKETQEAAASQRAS